MRKKRLFGIMLAALVALCILPGSALTAKADDPVPVQEVYLSFEEPAIGKAPAAKIQVRTVPAEAAAVAECDVASWLEVNIMWPNLTRPMRTSAYEAGRIYTPQVSTRVIADGYIVDNSTVIYVNGKPNKITPSREPYVGPLGTSADQMNVILEEPQIGAVPAKTARIEGTPKNSMEGSLDLISFEVADNNNRTLMEEGSVFEEGKRYSPSLDNGIQGGSPSPEARWSMFDMYQDLCKPGYYVHLFPIFGSETEVTFNGVSTSQDDIVYGPLTAATGISLDKSEAVVTAGSSLQLKATQTPEGAASKILWSSSDESIAKVDEKGKVTGVKAGNAVITAKAGEGVTASCNVRVLFTDVADSSKYFYEPVYWAVAHKPQITSGTSATEFSPSNPCTRAQIVTFLWHAAGDPAPKTTKNPFTDVKAGSYYYNAVLWAVEQGITTGTSATTFGPGNPCTRAQSMTFLYNAKGNPADYASINFTDVKNTSYYYNAVRWAVKNNITAGVNATQFGSGNTCTRAQIVTFLNKAYK